MKFIYVNEATNVVITEITADYVQKKISIVNHTDDAIDRAFGINEHPSFDDWNRFLESRCVPRSRGDIKTYLRTIGVDWYDPLLIVKKTGGRMAEDRNVLLLVEE